MQRTNEMIRARISQDEHVWKLTPLETSPCTLACPTRINARGYVSLIADGRFAEALELVRERNPFPGVCGRICPRPCEAACTRAQYDGAIAICALKRFVFDLEMQRGIDPAIPAEKSRAERIAVIGAGPAGLSAAAELARFGYAVTVFEEREMPGGMMNLIPDFRLPRPIVRRESKAILDSGIELVSGVAFGEDITWNRLKRRGYRALLLATGAWKPLWGWGSPGMKGVLHAVDFLEAAANPDSGERGRLRSALDGAVVVIGGEGMMALDSARTALRLGAASVVYLVGKRRELAALHRDDVIFAEKEGLHFEFLAQPKRLISKRGNLSAVLCARLSEGPSDATGRRDTFVRPDGDFTIAADCFIDAHSRGVDVRGFGSSLGLRTTSGGTIAVDPETAIAGSRGVFAAGDLVTGPRSVVEAIASGQKAAYGIHQYVSGETVPSPFDLTVDDTIAHREFTLEIVPENRLPRTPMPVEKAKERRRDFREVEKGFAVQAARFEAQRCLRCGPCSECTMCVDMCEKKDFVLRLGDETIVSAHAGREFWSAVPDRVVLESGGGEVEAAVVRTIARVDERFCVGCGRCADVCGYKAVQVEARPGNRFIAHVDDLACKGCGTCVAVCPTGAIAQSNFEDEAIMKHLATISSRTKVMFVCHWARPARLELPNDVIVVETMCVGRVTPRFIVEAALRGSPRILVCGCLDDACHYGFGRARGHHTVERARDILKLFGLNPGIVTEVSTRPAEFALAIDRWAWKSK
jgi:NADPH-dependent glutamate synthase beta subunit-like oxidoreductase/coenzyme F420-reducing hydrogenase delta subunit/Pyruvate/2-oxoacid:ferredoxin oxidoreductase delta subunit